MQTLTLQTIISEDGNLYINVPCSLPPGPAEVVIVAESFPSKSLRSLQGIWKGIVDEDFDIQSTLKDIRKEWEKEWEVR
ncbi:MAG: hypothetical protein ABIF11_07190 [Nitrospirota bacterium]